MGNPLDRLVTEQAKVNPLDALVTPSTNTEEPNVPIILPGTGLTLPAMPRKVVEPYTELGKQFVGAVAQTPAALNSIVRQANPFDHSYEAFAARMQTKQALGIAWDRIDKTAEAANTAIIALQGDNPAQAQVAQFATRTYNRLADGLAQAQADPTTVTSIPAIIVSGALPLITAPLEALSGKPVGRDSETGVLTAEEQAQAMFTTAGNFAAMYAGTKIAESLAARAVPKALQDAARAGITTPAALRGASEEVIRNIAGVGVRAAYGTKLGTIASHAITGLGAGAAFGAVEHIGQDDIINQTINYGIVGMALGGVMGFAQAKPVYQDRLAMVVGAQRLSIAGVMNTQRAEWLGKARLLNIFETQNFNDAIGSISALNSTSALARAVVAKQLSVPARFVLNNVDAASAEFVRKAMFQADYDRALALGMDETHAFEVARLRSNIETASTKKTTDIIPVGPINELTIDKIIAKAKIFGAPVQAQMLEETIGASVVRNAQFHGTPITNIVGNRLLPTEMGLHAGTPEAAHAKAMTYDPGVEGHIFPFIVIMKKPFVINDISSHRSMDAITRIVDKLHKNGELRLSANETVYDVRDALSLKMKQAEIAWEQANPSPKKINLDPKDINYASDYSRLSQEYKLWDLRRKMAFDQPVKDLLAKYGYDGLEYKNKWEDPGKTSYAIFDPDSQIMYLDEILQNMLVEKQSEQFQTVQSLNKLHEDYDFYPNELNAKTQPPSYAIRANADGTFNIAFSYGQEAYSPTDLVHFKRTGYMPGQPMNYDGKVAILKSVSPSGKLATLEVVGADGHITERMVQMADVTVRAEPVARARILATNEVYQDFINKSFRAEPATVNNSKLVNSVPAKNYKLPKTHEKATPRFGRNTIQFESDFDRGVYIAFSAKAEAGNNPKALQLRQHIREATGFTDAEMRDHREAVLSTLKKLTEAKDTKEVKLPRVVTMLENVQRLIPIKEAAATIPAEGKSWNKLVETYALENGYNETDIPDLSRQLSGRFFRENVDATMDKHEAAVFKQHQTVLDDMLKTTTQPLRDLHWLDNTMRTRGQYIEHHSGAIVIKDIASGRELFRGTSIPDVVEKMNRAGATEGVSADGGNNGIGVPPVEAVPPSGNAGQSPFVRHDDKTSVAARVREVFDSFRSTTKADAFFVNLERLYGNELYSKLFYNLRNAVDSYAGDYVKLMENVLKPLERYKLTSDERLQAGELQETYSANDIRTKGFYNNRPATQLENELGTELGNNPAIDITKVANYVTILDYTYKQNRENFLPRMEKAKVDLQMNADELAFVEKFKRAGQTEEISRGTMYALAQAVRGDVMGTPFLSQTEFIKKFNVSDKVQAFVKESMDADKALASQFGLPEEFRINPYMTHKRTYGSADYSTFVDEMDPNEIAYFKMHRTGLLDEYERDPIFAKAAYIRAGLQEQHLTPVIQNMNELLQNPAMKKLLGADYNYVKDRVEAMVRDIRGIPDDATAAFNQKAAKYLEALGLGDDVRRLVSVTNAWTDAAFQGGAAFAGFRDILSGLMKTSINMKWSDGPAMIKRGSAEAMKRARGLPNAIDDLMDRGIIKKQTISGLESVDQAGASFSNTQSSGLIRAAESVGRAGLITSGQPTVHETLQAGLYLHVWERAGESLKKFRKGEIGTQEFSRINQVSSYDAPITERFNKLVEQNLDAEAADYLAKEAIAVNLGRYGHGNNPHGWSSWWMRLVGQYGQYMTDHKSFVLRGLANGSIGDRAAFSAKYAAANTALIAVGYYTSTNVYSAFGPLTGLAYSGGPVTSLVRAFGDGLSGRNGYGSGIDYLEDILPYNSQGWNLNQTHAWLPFSRAMTDYYQAVDMIANDVGSDEQKLVRGLGIKPTQ